MIREACCADGGACDCVECRPDPLTVDHVVAVLERFGAGLDTAELDELASMSADELGDELEYHADYQG